MAVAGARRTYQSFLPPREQQAEAGSVDATAETGPHAVSTATGADLAPLKKTVDARRCWMFRGRARTITLTASRRSSSAS
jgi:hypothetical protein